MKRFPALCFLATVWLMVCQAQEMTVPVSLQVALFNKVLPFDRSLHSRSQGKIVIGLVYQSRYKTSLEARAEFIDALSRLPVDKIANLPYKLVNVDINEGSLQDAISTESIDILYITPLRAVAVDEITDISRDKGVLTLTGVTEYVHDGISVGIGTKAGKPQILINLKSARLERADFSSQLLQVARIVESEEVQ